jgi:hypothetical protein
LAKTITDCFKLRSKVGLNVALEALREGWRGAQVHDGRIAVLRTGQPHDQRDRPYLEAVTG